MTHDYVAWTGPNCGHVHRCGRADAGPHRDVDLRELAVKAQRALLLAAEGWKCETCEGKGYYAEPVHVCGGDEDMCSRRCPEAEQTRCQRCDEIASAGVEIDEALGEPGGER